MIINLKVIEIERHLIKVVCYWTFLQSAKGNSGERWGLRFHVLNWVYQTKLVWFISFPTLWECKLLVMRKAVTPRASSIDGIRMYGMTSIFFFGGKLRKIYLSHFDRKRCWDSPLYSVSIKVLVGLIFRSKDSHSYSGMRSIERALNKMWHLNGSLINTQPTY